MPSTQVRLNDEENKTVKMVKAVEDISSKEKAIKHIIRQFETEK